MNAPGNTGRSARGAAPWRAGRRNTSPPALRAAHPGLEVTLEIIVTEGDRFQTGPLIEVGGKGVWVKDIEVALAEGRVDLAVHSLKDVPAELAPGLALVAIPPRADARDALVSRTGADLAALPAGRAHRAPPACAGSAS